MSISSAHNEQSECSDCISIMKSSFSLLKEMNTHAILCYLVKSLNHVAYEHILIERVTEKVERMLTAINVSRVFI